MRGADALPGSKATSRAQGSHRRDRDQTLVQGIDSVFRGSQALRSALDLNLADDLDALGVKAQDRK
jgi:hypothetical protein